MKVQIDPRIHTRYKVLLSWIT
jgi:hypothetical protein